MLFVLSGCPDRGLACAPCVPSSSDLRVILSIAGYDLIEIPMLDPGTVDTAMTAAVLEEAGIKATTSLVCSRQLLPWGW